MTPEIKKLFVYCAFGFAIWGVMAYSWWRTRKLRRRMLEEGRLSRNRPPVRKGPLIAMIFLCVVSISFGVYSGVRGINLDDRKRLPWILGGCVGFALIMSAILTLKRHDRFISRAATLSKQGRNDEAVTVLRAAIAERASVARYEALGTILIRAECFDEALAAFREAAAGDSDNPRHAINQSLAALKLNRRDEAIDLLTAARQRWPREAALVHALGLMYIEADRNDEAAEQFKQGDELGSVAASDQRCDWLTRSYARKALQDKLAERGAGSGSVRGFPVAARSDRAVAEDQLNS